MFESSRCEELTDCHQCEAGLLIALVYKFSHGQSNSGTLKAEKLMYNHSRAGRDDSSSYHPTAYITLMYACMDSESRMFESEGKQPQTQLLHKGYIPFSHSLR